MESKLRHFAKQLTQESRNAMVRLASPYRPLRPTRLPTVAVNMYPAFGSWGGSSAFVHQLVAALRRCGFRAVFDLRRDVDVILMIDPRDDLQNKAFGLDDIKRYRVRHPCVKIIHRINECDQRKNTAFMDDLLRAANAVADYTVFISEWLKEYFIARWFDPARAHTVIYNGANPSVFHPVGGTKWGPAKGALRLVTHHWSPNPMKGFPVYKMLDDMIADGQLRDTELWVIGQWPANMHWRVARAFAPASGHRLASMLRQCHVYVTASLWEPCGMHHVEGAQCGLPLFYHEKGGGIVEVGRKYGIGFREDNIFSSLEILRRDYKKLRRRVFDYMPDGTRMAIEYIRVVQRILAGEA